MALPLWLRFLNNTAKTVTVLTAVTLVYTRSLAVTYFVTGALLCSALAKVIKRAIRQKRPPQHSSHKLTSYGMPSSHASTCTFFAIYITLASLHHTLPPLLIFAPVLVLPWTCMIIISRVRLGHHTWPQVAAGSALGACCAAFWFKLWLDNASAIKTTAAILESRFSRSSSW